MYCSLPVQSSCAIVARQQHFDVRSNAITTFKIISNNGCRSAPNSPQSLNSQNPSDTTQNTQHHQSNNNSLPDLQRILDLQSHHLPMLSLPRPMRLLLPLLPSPIISHASLCPVPRSRIEVTIRLRVLPWRKQGLFDATEERWRNISVLLNPVGAVAAVD